MKQLMQSLFLSKAHDSAPDAPTPARRYLVPEGLRPRVLDLMDNAERDGMRHAATSELWRLIEARCPEIKGGRWRLSHFGAEVVVEEWL